jgi:photosystem II stability/assembly factor-like uncharacterized protein
VAQVASNDAGTVLIAVGAKGSVLRSTDAARTWKAARNATLDTDLRSVVNQPGTQTWIAAGTGGRVLRSTDDGRSWRRVESRLTVTFHTLFMDRGTGQILIGGDGGMVGFSKDTGMSWQITALVMPDPPTPVTAFHRIGKLLLATSSLGRFLTSQDDAQTWDFLQASSEASFTDCSFDPVRGAIVMIGHNGDVLSSRDGGKTWEGSEIALEGGRNFLSAILFDEPSASLLAVGHGGTVARSIDGGAHWSRASSDLRGEVRGLIEDPSRHRLVAFGANGMISTSTDSGAAWQEDQGTLELRR